MEQQPHENKNMQAEDSAEQQTPVNTDMEHSPTHDTPTADASGSGDEQSGPVGPIVGAIIVIAILVFGGLYFWGAHLNNTQQEEVPLILEDETAPGTSQAGSALGPEPGTSDEVGAIEEDAENIDMAQFEAEMEAELQALEDELNTM